jgi:hypothetical protein
MSIGASTRWVWPAGGWSLLPGCWWPVVALAAGGKGTSALSRQSAS